MKIVSNRWRNKRQFLRFFAQTTRAWFLLLGVYRNFLLWRTVGFSKRRGHDCCERVRGRFRIVFGPQLFRWNQSIFWREKENRSGRNLPNFFLKRCFLGIFKRGRGLSRRGNGWEGSWSKGFRKQWVFQEGVSGQKRRVSLGRITCAGRCVPSPQYLHSLPSLKQLNILYEKEWEKL